MDLLAVVVASIVFDFPLDDTRFDDSAFFVVLGLCMFGLGLLVRWIAKRFVHPATTPVG